MAIRFNTFCYVALLALLCGPSLHAAQYTIGSEADLPGHFGTELDLARSLIDSGAVEHKPDQLERALNLLEPILLAWHGSAEAWYQAGRARYYLAVLGAATRTHQRRLLGMSYAQRAIAALREALRRDPECAEAAALLADGRLRTLAGITDADDISTIRQATPLTSQNPDALIARARLELAQGEADSAIMAARRVIAVGGDSGLGLLTLARAQLLAGRLAMGETTWFRGLTAARSDSARHEYRQDIAWLASDAEMASFDSTPWGDRPAGAPKFWERRALADFSSVGERFAEQERPNRFALKEFALRLHKRDFNKATPYGSDQALVDDRGVIYIRHGPPTRIVRSGKETVQECPVRSWLYEDGPDRGMVVSFRPFFTLTRSPRVFCAYNDFKLVPGGVWAGANAAKLADFDSLYSRWLNEHRPLHRATLSRALVAESMNDLVLAATTDAYPLHFEHTLGAVVRGYGLAGPARLLFALGVLPANAAAITIAGRPALPLRLRVTALPADHGAPLAFDTTLVYDASRSLRPDQWIAGAVSFPVPPGEYEVRWVLTGADPTAGSTGLQLGIDVPAPIAGRPTVSALLLGTPNTELRWPTPAGPFPLSASNAYRVGDDMEVFLEAQDLPSGAPVMVRTRIEPADGAKGRSVTTQVTEHADGTSLAVRLSLHLSELEPGYFRLTVELGGASIRSVSRSQPFWVVE
jgi:tetratricopeptide (TPR) repeat protein